MKIIEAINILAPLSGALADIKTAYKRYCKKYHPDVNPDGLEMMKLGNLAFDMLKKNLDLVEREFPKFQEEAQQNENIAEAIAEIFTHIRHFPNIKIEVCGTWVWVEGDTKPIKEQLSALHFRWAFKKKKWAWHPATYVKRNRKGEWDMEKIRNTWGSTNLNTEPLKAVA